ncbi:substrate-binding periplasmic protein [Bdellovibrio svalbardensis]|uniref:Transporter substrate-binding domain-containing protein n=1 Tax=Bdellovibrio svalbardensis TaxID=2972972 RepID=A0ABT6DGC1_9BACT|nr:transporter substrate-binding domain-containing protein [Bdellovibrio svalbardensis]MDG0815903.1 transporter substrate-binding domain-containing protein [Bdellovibrio svalbardensis]
MSLILKLIFTTQVLFGVAQAKSELRVAIIDFPPFYGVDEQGKATGVLSARVRELLKASGYKMKPVFVPAKRMMTEVAAGTIDVWMGVSSFPEFKETTLIGKELFVEMKLSLWAYSRESFPEDMTVPDSRKIALIFGYSYGGLLNELKRKRSVSLVEVKSVDQASLVLKNQRASYLLNYDVTMEHWLANNSHEKMVSKSIKVIPCYIVVSKKHPQAGEVLRNLELALRDMKAKANSEEFIQGAVP